MVRSRRIFFIRQIETFDPEFFTRFLNPGKFCESSFQNRRGESGFFVLARIYFYLVRQSVRKKNT
ncbi:hypothetical protein CH367_05875 [Leptospira barantonii]|uniref:Uncharacterized protein n=1 Tax=Leptospira barantonii TaxID=2023184 RepID=A0ABX4NPW5_9LEPT|nr:hypothetical protein CH367_05875 [Leptospira barantonii]